MKKGRNFIVAVAITLIFVLGLAPRVAAAPPDLVDCTITIDPPGNGPTQQVVITVPRRLAVFLNDVDGVECDLGG